MPPRNLLALERQKRSPPDGKYGWVIVICSMMCSVVVDGICFSLFSVLRSELLIKFGESESKTAWVGSLLAGFYLTMGPISSALCMKFGCRIVTITGAVLSTGAFFGCYYATSLNMMIVLYGIIGGSGFGLIYLPAIVILGEWFDKRLSLATGIAVAGSGIGTFIFAPLSQVLVEEYTWRGTLWIMAGIIFNCAIFGCLFRQFYPLESELQKRYVKSKPKGLFQTIAAEKKREREKDDDNDVDDNAIITTENELIAPELGSDATQRYTGSAVWKRGVGSSGNLGRDRAQSHRSHFASTSMFTLPTSKQAAEELDDNSSDKEPSRFDELKKMFDFSLLRSPSFFILCMSSIFSMVGFFVPFVYTQAHAEEGGVTKEQSAYLLSILGATNTVGRIVVGFISDHPRMDALLINNVALVIAGITTILAPLTTDFVLLSLYCAIFGLCIAAFVSLRSIILVDMLGPEKLSNSFGILILFQGIASMIGSPIGGTIKDQTGSYFGTYCFAGALIAIAGLMLFPLRKIKAMEDRCLGKGDGSRRRSSTSEKRKLDGEKVETTVTSL